jgi:hypothetical protein
MRDDRRADCLACSMHELNDVGRQPRFQQHLDEHRPRMWHVLGGLEHDGVTAQQRRKDLPGGNGERKVEWRDDAGDTDRPTEAHGPLVP